jgi:hypothetical protein
VSERVGLIGIGEAGAAIGGLTDDELGATYAKAAEPVLGERRAAELGAALWRLREVASVRELGVLA